MNRRLNLAVAIVAAGAFTGCSGSETPSAARPDDRPAVSAPIVSDDPVGQDAAPTTAPGTEAPVSSSAAVGDTPPEPLVPRLDLVEVVAPEAVVADVAPEFVWLPVVGAASYRLVVLDPGGPVWAWEGSETSIRLGGLTADAGAGFPVPALPEGSTWSVAALDGDGNVVAVSDRRAISRS